MFCWDPAMSFEAASFSSHCCNSSTSPRDRYSFRSCRISDSAVCKTVVSGVCSDCCRVTRLPFRTFFPGRSILSIFLPSFQNPSFDWAFFLVTIGERDIPTVQIFLDRTSPQNITRCNSLCVTESQAWANMHSRIARIKDTLAPSNAFFMFRLDWLEDDTVRMSAQCGHNNKNFLSHSRGKERSWFVCIIVHA